MILGRGIVADVLTSLMFFRGRISELVPDYLAERIELWQERLKNYFFPSIRITFDEFTSGLYHRSDAYTAIEYYLSSKSATRVTRLKAESYKRKASLLFSSDHYEDIEDEFEGIKVTWYKGKRSPEKKIKYNRAPDDKNYYTLVFHPKDRNIVMERYLNHVLQEGKSIKKKRRQRKLYMNTDDGWDYTLLEHPASFDSFAMDPEKKKDIINDLVAFSQGKEYYHKIGKAWKRGYLLYGPPGTGKSTLILAMSNLLGYDIYDLELTTIKDNAHLKTLLINSSRKGIFVVEDIDCSLNITRKRKNKKDDSNSDDEHQSKSKVTLSGFLNFVDGIWSACGGERIIVFTTNHLDKLDPALIRRGRMDMHIELSYCTLGGFKVLAKNYLNLDSHPLFEKIGNLLEEVNMTPADVSEHLLHGRVGRDPKACLESLIEALETTKEEKIEEEDAKALETAKEERLRKKTLKPKEEKIEEEDVKQKGGIKRIMRFFERKKSN